VRSICKFRSFDILHEKCIVAAHGTMELLRLLSPKPEC